MQNRLESMRVQSNASLMMILPRLLETSSVCKPLPVAVLAQSAAGYVGTINRALTNGWNKDPIGHHLVRGNIIAIDGNAGRLSMAREMGADDTINFRDYRAGGNQDHRRESQFQSGMPMN